MEVLLFDDLGKAPSTEGVDAELFELVEVRTSNALPILWSANGGGRWLIDRLGADRGPALIRRLAEFTEVLKYETNEGTHNSGAVWGGRSSYRPASGTARKM